LTKCVLKDLQVLNFPILGPVIAYPQKGSTSFGQSYISSYQGSSLPKFGSIWLSSFAGED